MRPITPDPPLDDLPPMQAERQIVYENMILSDGMCLSRLSTPKIQHLIQQVPPPTRLAEERLAYIVATLSLQKRWWGSLLHNSPALVSQQAPDPVSPRHLFTPDVNPPVKTLHPNW
ncbi:rho-GTPase-activating protein [Histoplasma capsulatum G186AR]|uniref:Rho-GTPase-activating protein n=1 Tax=Ajellomyces capsulatus TaxID=5037 RepID=A0A8H8D7Y6_AJECA|nr:rho-GTPase-activating protein [Histoplasma capsulatum]QSS69952.1 rho-GTPase-activating protein [Histoplasma capsulatum G186AR]